MGSSSRGTRGMCTSGKLCKDVDKESKNTMLSWSWKHTASSYCLNRAAHIIDCES